MQVNLRYYWDFFQDGVVGCYLRSRRKKTSCFQIGFRYLSTPPLDLTTSTSLPANHQHGEILLFARRRGGSEETFVLACTYPTVKRVFGLDIVDISTSKRRLAWLPAVVVGRVSVFLESTLLDDTRFSQAHPERVLLHATSDHTC